MAVSQRINGKILDLSLLIFDFRETQTEAQITKINASGC
jgi:hypothetical protein